MIIVFLDKETNGYRKSSVLSATLWKYRLDVENRKLAAVDLFHRFYMPRERHDSRAATAAHGLWPDNLLELRKDKGWPEFFVDDSEAYMDFVAGADLFVAHNLAYDASFAPVCLEPGFCTMKSLKGTVPSFDRNGRQKAPSLAEACAHYGFPVKDAHTSLGDVKALVRLFAAMLGDRSPGGDLARAAAGIR